MSIFTELPDDCTLIGDEEIASANDEFDFETLEHHRSMLWHDGKTELVVAGLAWPWTLNRAAPGLIEISIEPEDINAINALWGMNSKNEETERMIIVGSLQDAVDELCDAITDIDSFTNVATARARALEWAVHIEKLAKQLRDAAEGREPR